jgi:hypothetical protein
MAHTSNLFHSNFKFDEFFQALAYHVGLALTPQPTLPHVLSVLVFSLVEYHVALILC